jgi:hypothetical protein
MLNFMKRFLAKNDYWLSKCCIAANLRSGAAIYGSFEIRETRAEDGNIGAVDLKY